MFTATPEGVLRVGLWVLGLLAFAVYYARSYHRHGLFTFTSFWFARHVVLVVFLMLPFAHHPENAVATGAGYYAYLQQLDRAFYLSVLGVVAMLTGMALASPSPDTLTRAPVLNTLQTALSFWQARLGFWLALGILGALTAYVVLVLGVTLFQGRQFGFENTAQRPIINLLSVCIGFLALNILVRGARLKSPVTLAVGLACTGLGLLIGTRGASIEILLTFGAICAITYRFKNLGLAALAVAVLFVAAIIISYLRSETPDTFFADGLGATLFNQVLYGNNFADLRDYAWILSGFDGPYYWGKTYLAGYFAFVPSYISDFRTTYATGRITSALAGLNPDFHAGLRPTTFGEAYLNFGLPGIVLMAAAFGYVFRRLHLWAHHHLLADSSGLLRVHTAFVALQLAHSLVFTPGFFRTYVLLALLAFGWLMARHVMPQRAVQSSAKPPTSAALSRPN